MRNSLGALREWAQLHYGEAIDAFVEARFGSPPAADQPHDIDRSIDDFLCSPGSAGHDRTSIVKAFANKAQSLDDTECTQVVRWARERRRGVFLIQRATRDTLEVWDPLEGAPLSLHLLERIGNARARDIVRGTVAVASYMPWIARLVATGRVEFFDAAEALPLFRRHVEDDGAVWHDLPAVVPTRSKIATASTTRSAPVSEKTRSEKTRSEKTRSEKKRSRKKRSK